MSGTEPFQLEEVRGEVSSEWRPTDLAAAVERLTDPARARETVHWGRNYLYSTLLETEGGEIEVVVKQFRNRGAKKRLRRRLEGSKAEKHWRAAKALTAAGIATPDLVLLIESLDAEGPSFVVTRRLEGALEVRYYLRAVNAGRNDYPQLPLADFLDALAVSLRRLHDAGVWHRDVSVGNLLVELDETGGRPLVHYLDLNRARLGRRLTVWKRTRDLCRLRIFDPAQQRRFLDRYWEGRSRGMAWKRFLYALLHKSFLWRTDFKDWLRRPFRGLGPRTAHAHIPDAAAGASARDRTVWDRLSDQPHQHTGRLGRFGVRLADAGTHLAETAAFLRASPRIWRRYRSIQRELYAAPSSWSGVGVAVRPWPRDPEGLLEALEELGVRDLYLRLDTWDEGARDAEEELARELSARGYQLAFGVPQDRMLVREPERWEEALREIARRFTPYGRHFQIGQAINRSKWGVWNYDEYRELLARAERTLREHPGVELLGPAVIDFELYATAAVLNMPWNGHRLDAVSSLLYVDRRGAPERTQLGFDTVGKVALVKAIAETSRNSGPGSWITEVNWPLWEGPHAPAGRKVAVSEETQADYLARFYLLTLGTGLVERVFWWQLVARGYGLVCPEEDGTLRRRPSFLALRTLAERLAGTTFVGPAKVPSPAHVYRFETREGTTRIAAWSSGDRVTAPLSAPIRSALDRDGRPVDLAGRRRVELTGSVLWLDL
ncbi:MAG: lipopolysaccharide kinase InaA family protein [Thermoanaerobaculia bacterium]